MRVSNEIILNLNLTEDLPTRNKKFFSDLKGLKVKPLSIRNVTAISGSINSNGNLVSDEIVLENGDIYRG